ncbi:hypothetical protein PSAC2689_100088 [Paraburkholderia sacchari]
MPRYPSHYWSVVMVERLSLPAFMSIFVLHLRMSDKTINPMKGCPQPWASFKGRSKFHTR